MALKYLLDTNILSEPVRAKPHPFVMAQLQVTTGQIAIAATTWHELWFGLYKLPISRKRTAIEQYLVETIQLEVPILPYDGVAAEWFARERARLTQLGRAPAYADGQIAAVASANNLILVTRNTADFNDFSNLHVQNWFDHNDG